MATNIWPNADFEAGVSDWPIGVAVQSSTRAWEQTYSALCDTGGLAYTGMVSDAKDICELSTSYQASFYVWVDDAGVNLRFVVEDSSENFLIGNTYTSVTPGEWVRFSEYFTSASDDTSIVIKIYQDSTTVDTNFYVDAIMIETFVDGNPSEWVNYSAVGSTVELVIADASLALSADGSGSVDGLWDLGAYIYTSGSGIVLEVGGVDVLLAIANASLALSSESPALGPALSIANASLALSSDSLDIDAGASIVVDANRIAKIIFVMQNG